jgi:importin subunit beta-1
VVSALLQAIRDEPHVAEKVCYAVGQLAQGFRGADPSPLSPYFKDLVSALLEAAARPLASAEAVRLQTQAFEAVNEVVRASAPEAAPLVAQLLPVVLGKLGELLTGAAAGSEGAERQEEMAGLLCGVVTVVVQHLTEQGEAARGLVLGYADAIMQTLLRVFADRPGAATEATLTAGAMTHACEAGFAKYLDALFPVLERGLQAAGDWQACAVPVGLLSDVCRAVEAGVLPYCDRIMLCLLRNLQSDEVHRKVKPIILSVFGDVALAAEDRFEVYLAHVIQMLQSAAGLSLAQQAAAAGGDEGAAEYNAELRLGILEAWAGMFNGLSKPRADQYLSQYAPGLIEFVEAVAADEGADPPVLKAAAALLGDVASKLTGVGVLFQQKPFVQAFLGRCAEEEEMEDTARWASAMVGAAQAAAAQAAQQPAA